MPAGVVKGKNREIALATLVELLVQIIFVFTLVLLATQALEGAPGDRGWIAPEAWRTLISIFDVNPDKIRRSEEQIKEIKKRYENTKRQLNEAIAESSTSRAAQQKAEEELAKLRGRGGPGNPVCRDSRGDELVVLEASVNVRGEISIQPTAAGVELNTTLPLPLGIASRPITPTEFRDALRNWRTHGLKGTPPCAYKAVIRFDATAPAGSYERARQAIVSYFHMALPPKGQ